jgi:hypothetical protein
MMGMFDTIKVKYLLPELPKLEHPELIEWQSKDTDAQQMDNYEFRSDGTLWHEEYDSETVEDPNPKNPFGFYLKRNNKRWRQEVFTGAITFYGENPDMQKLMYYTALFKDGQVLNVVKH